MTSPKGKMWRSEGYSSRQLQKDGVFPKAPKGAAFAVGAIVLSSTFKTYFRISGDTSSSLGSRSDVSQGDAQYLCVLTESYSLPLPWKLYLS